MQTVKEIGLLALLTLETRWHWPQIICYHVKHAERLRGRWWSAHRRCGCCWRFQGANRHNHTCCKKRQHRSREKKKKKKKAAEVELRTSPVHIDSRLFFPLWIAADCRCLRLDFTPNLIGCEPCAQPAFRQTKGKPEQSLQRTPNFLLLYTYLF